MTVNKEGGVEDEVKVEVSEKEEPKIDAFGSDNQPPEPPKKPEEKKVEDVESLKKQIEEVKKEYGGNLSGQRDVIKRLEAEIETLKKGGSKKEGEEGKEEEGGEEVLFKDIKWSKDLTEDERDEMTETEIKQMDEIASMKEAQNKLFAQQSGNKTTDLNNTVRTTASELAKEMSGKEDVEKANQIIEAVKMFNLEGLNQQEVIERVRSASKLIPDYVPPKEQVNKSGNPIKTGGQGGSDPFGVDKIIEEATSVKDGNYQL